MADKARISSDELRKAAAETEDELRALLKKSHVKAYTRRTKSGAVATVAEHDDSRTKEPYEAFKSPNGSAWFVGEGGSGSSTGHRFKNNEEAKQFADALNKKEGRTAKKPVSDQARIDHEDWLEEQRSRRTTGEIRSAVMSRRSFEKAHVKTYQRTTASGTSVTVKEHDDSRQRAIASASKAHLGIDSLKEKKSDRDDFKDLHVSRVKEALHAAYKAGGGKSPSTDHLLPVAKKHLLVHDTFEERGLDRHDFKEGHVKSIEAALGAAHDLGKKEKKTTKKTPAKTSAAPRTETANEGNGFHGIAQDHHAEEEVGKDGDIYRAPESTIRKVEAKAAESYSAAADHLVKNGHFDSHEKARDFLDSRMGRHLGDTARDHGGMDLSKVPEKNIKDHVRHYKLSR